MKTFKECVDERDDGFYVIAREPGAEHPSLPTWASRRVNPAALSGQAPAIVERREVAGVPGAYQLLNVLSAEECERLISLTEALGYQEDAAVSLPRDVRHNDNVVWVADDETNHLLWRRVEDLADQELAIFDGARPLGLNARYRFYKYNPGDYFKFHIDGAWPGSRVIDNTLIHNAYPDRYSQMTFLVLLSSDFDGGATRFRVPDSEGGFRFVDVRTPAGSVLCFPHGLHPLHCLHSSEPIVAGTKYIIRTDMLFSL